MLFLEKENPAGDYKTLKQKTREITSKDRSIEIFLKYTMELAVWNGAWFSRQPRKATGYVSVILQHFS